MNGPLFILVCAVATSVGSSLAFLVAHAGRKRFATAGRWLIYATALLQTSALGYLAVQFVTTDYTNQYVWSHTADYLSLGYRLSGVYAGVEGSLLLWATLVGLAVAWFTRRSTLPRNSGSLAVGAAIAAVFAVMVALRPPFADLYFAAGETAYGPAGLNPLLKNPYMGIHPPITFLGYALTIPPFAIVAVHWAGLLRGSDGGLADQLPAAFGWLRASWVALSGAIALGALWSYNTLGWGGLWAWDPVETAVLITWIVVTAGLHALGNFRRRGQNALLAPALVGLSFPAVLFARFITQSGTSPLHSFGGATSPFLAGMLLVGLLVSLGPPLFLWAAGREIGTPLEEDLFAPGTVLYLSVLLLCLLGAVFVWGIGLPIVGDLLGARLEVGVDFYNLWGYPFAILGLLLIGFYHQATTNGRRALPVFGGVLVLTLLAAVVPVAGWTIAPGRDGFIFGALGSANFLVFGPPVAYAVLGLGESLGREFVRLEAPSERVALVGRTLVHLGLILVLLAGPFTYLFATSAAGFVPAASHAGGPVPVADSEYSLELTDYHQAHRPTDDDFTTREERALREAVAAASFSPAAVADKNLTNAVVYGVVTDRETNEGVISAQLNDTSVWVSVREGANTDLQVGTGVWAQGPINASQNRTWIEASGAFVGPAVTDAIVPEERLVTRHSEMTIYRNGAAIDAGRLGVDRYLGHGTFSSPHVHQGLLSDTYVVAQEYRSIQGLPVFYVLVKDVPLVNLVRIGIGALLLGGLLLLRFDDGTRPG